MSNMKLVELTGKKKKPFLRRAGFLFRKGETIMIDWDKLTDEQRKALENEPWLTISDPEPEPIVKVVLEEEEEKPTKKEPEEKPKPVVLVCKKCGKKYKSERYYKRHIKKCKG